MKNNLHKWDKQIEEISNNIWKVTLTHELGTTIEKTGTNLEQIEIEIEQSAHEMEKQIGKKIKKS